MYGAYWCPHCCEQKLLFGAEAVEQELPYTECDLKGKDAKPDICQQEFAAIQQQTGKRAGFPTWKINGKYLLGPQELKSLAQASNYQGPQDFKNQFANCKPL
jgi:glutaredoxin